MYLLSEGAGASSVQSESIMRKPNRQSQRVSDDAIMEEIRIILRVASDAPDDKIREVEQLALERCPVVYTLRHRVTLSPFIEIER